MAIIDHIDATNRRIYLHADTVGVDLEPMDIYKEMRTFRRTDETVRPFDCFLESKGKEPKGSGKFTERYVVCLGGTRIVPYDVSQILTVIGTIITDDGQSGIACFDKSLLTVTTRVDIHYEPPQVEVIEVTVASDVDDIAAAVLGGDIEPYHDTETLAGSITHLKHLEYKLFIDTELVDDGDGSQHAPYNNETSAIDYAEAHGLKDLILYSELNVTRSLKNFTIRGVGTPLVTFNGNDLKGSEYNHCELTGTYINRITAQDCKLTGPFTLHGFFEKCAISSDFTIPDGTFAFTTGLSPQVVGSNMPSFDIGGVAGTATLSLMDHEGGVVIKNMTQVTDDLKIDLHGGIVVLDVSCTLGDVRLFGEGTLVNNSSIVPLINELRSNDSIAEAVMSYTR